MKYTDEELKGFARKVIEADIENPDFMGVGEQFEDEWAHLDEDEFHQVQLDVHNLACAATVTVSFPGEQSEDGTEARVRAVLDAAVEDTERLGLEVQALTEERDAARAEQTRLLAEVEDERRRRASYVQGMRAGYDAEIDRLKRNGEALIDRAVQAEAERDELDARLDAAWTVIREGDANMRGQLATVRDQRDEAHTKAGLFRDKRDHLAEQVEALRALTQDEDGNVLPPESELPVGVFYGVLYGEETDRDA